MTLRTVTLSDRSRGEGLHVETPLGVVNIRHRLHDVTGRRVVSVEIIPNDYAGEPAVTLDGFANTRLIEGVSR